jgi:hypothetical protein
MTEQPAALQLRLLQTVVEVAAERNSTLVLPFPVELLRFLERGTPPAPAGPTPARPTINEPISMMTRSLPWGRWRLLRVFPNRAWLVPRGNLTAFFRDRSADPGPGRRPLACRS